MKEASKETMEYLKIDRKLYGDITDYIDNHYKDYVNDKLDKPLRVLDVDYNRDRIAMAGTLENMIFGHILDYGKISKSYWQDCITYGIMKHNILVGEV